MPGARNNFYRPDQDVGLARRMIVRASCVPCKSRKRLTCLWRILAGRPFPYLCCSRSFGKSKKECSAYTILLFVSLPRTIILNSDLVAAKAADLLLTYPKCFAVRFRIDFLSFVATDNNNRLFVSKILLVLDLISCGSLARSSLRNVIRHPNLSFTPAPDATRRVASW